MQFDMNATWQRATALLRGNFQLLAIIAGVFLLLPSVVLYMAVPEMAMFANPAGDPEAMAKQMEAIAPTILGWSAILLVFQAVGYMAMIALMGHGRPTVAEALTTALKSLPSALGAMVLFIIGISLVTLLVTLVIGMLVAALGVAALAFLMVLIIMFVMLLVSVRLMLTLPVIMLEQERNPYTAMRASWRLTGPHKWRILGFWLLLMVAYFVIAFVLLGIFGVLGAFSASSTGSLLVLGVANGVIGALVAMLFSGILVAMHEQLAGARPEKLSETFD